MTTKTLTAGPKLKTAIPGPNAKRIVAGDDQIISPSYTRVLIRWSPSADAASSIEDVDGNEFFDFSAGIAVTSTGHCHPEVVAAIQKQAGELIHMSGTDFYYESMVTLAERLSKIAPMPGPHRIYYGNSGTEAVECALKLARYHTKRQQVIAFFGAFHGRTMGALSLTASKPQQKRRFSPLVPGVTHVRYPDVYRGCEGGPQDARSIRARLRALHRRQALQDDARRRRKWRQFSLSRFRARADTWSLRRCSCRNCGGSATSTASCWWWTKCSRAWAAPASGGRWSTPACSRTSFAAPRALRRACRSAWSSARRMSWTGFPVHMPRPLAAIRFASPLHWLR